eukprot:1431500-Rhodomonas_salina.2
MSGTGLVDAATSLLRGVRSRPLSAYEPPTRSPLSSYEPPTRSPVLTQRTKLHRSGPIGLVLAPYVHAMRCP